MVVVLLQSPRYLQSDAPISKHSKQVYCNVVHVRGYPMNIIPAVICPYLPFSPTYEADNCIVVILSLFWIEWTWSQPLNRTFCQSTYLGLPLICQIRSYHNRWKRNFEVPIIKNSGSSNHINNHYYQHHHHHHSWELLRLRLRRLILATLVSLSFVASNNIIITT